MTRTQQLLDEVQRESQLAAFAPDAWVSALEAELAPGASIEAWDAQLRAAVDAIDGFAQKSMRIRLDRALAGDGSIGTTFRRTLTATVTRYEGDLDTLRDRVSDVASRTDPGGAATTAAAVVEAAVAALADRTRLRDGVAALVRAQATARLPAARLAEREPMLDDAERARLRELRRELELLVASPARALAHPLARRLASLPVEAAPAPVEPLSREELIELD